MPNANTSNKFTVTHSGAYKAKHNRGDADVQGSKTFQAWKNSPAAHLAQAAR